MSKLKIEAAPLPEGLEPLRFFNGVEMEVGQPEAYVLEADGATWHLSGAGNIWGIFQDGEYVATGADRGVAFSAAQAVHDAWLRTK